jgi:hypothetical protein
MPNRIAVNSLNARTIDILNVIRNNASLAYQNAIPEISKEVDIPAVGEKLYGYPALANEFINALVNRIAMVRIKSATFNNAYAELKKGYLEFGETVEEVFVAITKAREFSAEKAAERELKRSLPDVKAAFHVRNYRVQYPITIQDDDLRTAFQSINGVQDLIARIVDAVYTGAEYDEFLLFKYLLIKAITKGAMKVVTVTGDIKATAKAYRGVSNKLTFMSNQYNEAGVTTATPREDQYIFMDADSNAEYDVDVLAGAFNMDKAEFIGHLKLIDDWTTFDNDRFNVIRENSDMLEEVTAAELTAMAGVKGVLLDKEWFQVYDNLNKMTEQYVASGLYWNYFYHVWKTVSSSPFSNAVVFMDANAFTIPNTIIANVTTVSHHLGSDDINATALAFRFTDSNSKPLDGVKLLQEGAFAVDKLGGSALVAINEAGIMLYDPTTLGDTFGATNDIVCEYQGAKYTGNLPFSTEDKDFDYFSPITFTKNT